MWNILVCACVCVGQTEAWEGSGREENLGQTGSEPHLKWWRKCIQPVGNKYEGSGNVRPANKVEVWEKAGGLVEVCQLHNDAPPRLEAEYIDNFHYINSHGNQEKKQKLKEKKRKQLTITTYTQKLVYIT